jgi:hypothetical protein
MAEMEPDTLAHMRLARQDDSNDSAFGRLRSFWLITE